MRPALVISLFALMVAAPAAAQIDQADPDSAPTTDGIESLGDLLEQLEDDQARNRNDDPPDGITVLPAPDIPQLIDPEGIEPDMPPLPDITGEAAEDEIVKPDYSRLSSRAERALRLDDMFARLREAEEEEDAKLVAEEIWSVWTRSGSASVDFTLRRAASAQTRGQKERARALFDHVTRLQPDFAEGWARSARLALDERDFSRAVGDAVRALEREPRHYYALWTLGSVLERLGKPDEALEAYREAQGLYPALEQVSERVTALEAELDGGVL